MTETALIADIQARKKLLRKEMRGKRRQLSQLLQRRAARALYQRVVQSSHFRFAKRLAFTLARDGEISVHLLLREAQRRGKQCFLPVMTTVGESKLQFRLATAATRYDSRNNFGIPEPKRSKACAPRWLNLVLLPLVAFDSNCNRLGMGKGYYDHSFAFLPRSQRQQPVLLGLAHDCQRVDALELNPWDVRLHGIVTDRQWYKAPKETS